MNATTFDADEKRFAYIRNGIFKLLTPLTWAYAKKGWMNGDWILLPGSNLQGSLQHGRHLLSEHARPTRIDLVENDQQTLYYHFKPERIRNTLQDVFDYQMDYNVRPIDAFDYITRTESGPFSFYGIDGFGAFPLNDALKIAHNVTEKSTHACYIEIVASLRGNTTNDVYRKNNASFTAEGVRYITQQLNQAGYHTASFMRTYSVSTPMSYNGIFAAKAVQGQPVHVSVDNDPLHPARDCTAIMNYLRADPEAFFLSGGTTDTYLLDFGADAPY